MKIKLLDRIFLFLGAVLVILAGAALIVIGLQFTGVFAENVPLWIRIVCIAVGVLQMAYGVYIITFPHRYSTKRKEFVVQRTDSGELRIAVKAIENLVQKCVDLHEEIHLEKMDIINGREGVVVDLDISLANNISIPLAVASLQKQIKQYLVASSGIEVMEVRVSVESTQDEPEVLEEIKEEEAAAPERVVVKEAKEKKAPLHQRLFGKADQPAIVPEPPKAEPEAEAPTEEAEASAEEIPAVQATEDAVQEAAEAAEKTAEQAAEEQPVAEIAEEAVSEAENALDEAKETVQEMIPEAEEILPEPEEEKHETEEPGLE